MRPELHDRGDDLGRDLREFGDEHRGERLLDLRLVLLEAAGALDLEKVLVFFDIAATADVRLVERWLSQGQIDPGTEESRAVAQWLYEGRPPHLFRRFDLQGGAVLLKRSPSQIRFAQILRETYVDMWTGKQHQKRDHRGKDQPALDAAALRFGLVEALPTTFNLKPNHCSSHGHLARGAVRFLHWKDKTRTSRRKEVCRIVNANATARLIVGLSKCGMHGEEPVRLKRLKRPWIDED